MQSRFVSSMYLQSFKVGQQLQQELLANFKGYSKLKTTFVFLCAHDAMLDWWSWYTRQCPCTEQFNCDFLHNSCYYYVCLQRTPSSWYFNAYGWGGHSYGQALFSSLRLVKDSGLVVINLINLENADVLFCSITHTNHIIQYIRKEYRQNTGDVDLLPCYNYYSSENIWFFLTIWKSDLFSIILHINLFWYRTKSSQTVSPQK